MQGFNLTACLHLAHSQWCTWVLVLQECLLAPLHIHNWSGFLCCMQGHKKACLNTLHVTLTNTWFLCHVQGCIKVCKFACTFAHSQLCMDFGLFAMVQEVLLVPLKIMHNWAWFFTSCARLQEGLLTLHFHNCARILCCVRFQEGLLAPYMLTKVQGSCVTSVQGSIIWLACTFPHS